MIAGFVTTMALASAWWSHQGYDKPVCAPVHAVPLSDDQMYDLVSVPIPWSPVPLRVAAYMATDTTNCIIYIDEQQARDDRRNSYDWVHTYCPAIFHEYGHLLGLGHDAPFKVMAAWPDPSYTVKACSEASHFFSRR